jgi:metal-dependent amidase/aminoacylase/carboxypeptidase family protein
VELAGTIRTFDEDTRQRVFADLTHVAESVASALLTRRQTGNCVRE